MGLMISFYTFKLTADGDGVVSWEAPDGQTYSLNPAQGSSGSWIFKNDVNGNKVMGYRKGNTNEDGELVLSLRGSPGIAATLLHNEDDIPQKYYFATDSGNNNPLKSAAFVLRSQGVQTCPVKAWATFKVLVVN